MPPELPEDGSPAIVRARDRIAAGPRWLGSRWRGAPRWLRWPVVGAAALCTLVFVAGMWLWFTTELPPPGGLGESAILLDRNGEELAVLSQEGTRVPVELADLPEHVPAALVAAEDRRFYDHTGIDPVGITRAFWNNLTDDDLEGGSTITQQLVKNVYLDSDRTITRKLREAVLAVKLERTEDKDQILERYLDTVYFGRGAYGIEAAARAYFDSHAAELDPAQSAMLVGMLRAPESFDPAGAPDDVKQRRDQVVDTMVAMGALDAAEGEAAEQQPIQVVPEPSTTSLTAGVAPHFVEQIRAEIIDRFGEEALYSQGLVVHTTLDIADQRAAEASVATHLDDPGDPQAAVVGIDRSGAVRAWVGGRDFDELQLDLLSDDAGTGRQPGSTFKPVVLAANLAAGNGAGVRYAAPSTITLDVGESEPWTVRNAGGGGYGVITLAEATVNSVNTVYAQAVLEVGPEAVAELGHELGVSTELEPRPSIALGTEEILPIELATVFSTLSREGRRVDPYRITRIEGRNGRVLFEREEVEGDQVLEANVANTVSSILAEVPRRGTATRAALDRPMAAKTGTTQRNADAWLAGYTPEYTAVVWVGNAEGNEPMDPVDGQPVSGGSIPAMIWHDFMAEALTDVAPTGFPEPDPDLLADTRPAASLTATPSRLDPGGTARFEAVGLAPCIRGWWVSVTGPTTPFADPEPVPDDDAEGAGNEEEGGSSPSPSPDPVEVITLESPVQSDDERGSTSIAIPASADEGFYTAELHCDAGAGGKALASTELVIGERAPTTTTTSSTTSSSTTSSSSTTTTSSTSSTTTSSTSSTTTTTTTSTTTTPSD